MIENSFTKKIHSIKIALTFTLSFFISVSIAQQKVVISEDVLKDKIKGKIGRAHV